MFNLNPDVINVPQLELLNISNENKKVAPNEVSAKVEKETDKDVKVNLSAQVLNQINEIMAEEDLISLKFNKAQTIYDSLANIRSKLHDLMQLLKDPEMIFEVSTLEQMDSMSNSLIDNVIDVVKNNDDMNIVNSDFLNIYFSGLNSIKQLNLADNDFLSKIQMIESNVKVQENEYFKAVENLYSKYEDINKKYEELVNTKGSIDDKNIDKQIIETSKQSLADTTTSLTSESVKRVLIN